MSDTFTHEEREKLRRAFAVLDERTPVAPELDEVVTAPLEPARPTRRRWPVAALALGAFAGVVAVIGVAALLAGGDDGARPPAVATLPPADFAAVEAAAAAAVDCIDVRGGQAATAEFRDDLDEFVFSVRGGSAASPEIATGCVSELYAPVSAAWAATEGRSHPADMPVEASVARRVLILLAAGDEEGWLCPARRGGGYRELRPIGDAPEAVRYLPATAPRGLELAAVRVGDEGPSCRQGPALIVTAPGPDGPAAGVAVWPETTRFEDVCAADCSFDGRVEELSIDGSPARLHEISGSFEVWWTDGSGVPLRATASGLDQATLLQILGRMDATPARVEVDPRSLPAGWRVAYDADATGEWRPGYDWRAAYGEGAGAVGVEIRPGAAFHPLAMLVRNVASLQQLEVGGRPAVFIAEHGITTIALDDGLIAQVTGVADPAEAAAILASLEPVALDDPRLDLDG